MPTSLIETGVRLQGSALIVQGTRLGSETLSTHALMRSGILQLTKWGLLDAVIDAGTPAIQRTLFHYGAEYEPVPVRPAAGVDALYGPRRTLIDRLLGCRAGAAAVGTSDRG